MASSVDTLSGFLRDSDWVSMAHSLEIRTPLVDATLLAAVVPLISGAHPMTKRDMASAPAKPLPEAVLNRPKTGFSVPIREWLGGGDRAVGGQSYRDWARFVYSRYTDTVSPEI